MKSLILFVGLCNIVFFTSILMNLAEQIDEKERKIKELESRDKGEEV